MPRIKKIKLNKLLSANPKTKYSWFTAYHDSLNEFWKGNTRKALNNLTGFLETNPGSEGRFAFYRLWIECASLDQDYSSFTAIREHLQVRSNLDDESDFSEDYAGLIGLIHLMVDEFEAAELYASSYDEDNTSPYMEEFYSIYAERAKESASIRVPFQHFKSEVFDYFHLRQISQYLVGSKYEDDHKSLCSFVQKSYGKCPLLFANRIAKQIRKGAYGRALNYASELKDLYSKNNEFKSLHATLLTLAGDNKSALKQVFSLLKKEVTMDEVQLANWCFLDNAENGLKNTKSSFKSIEDSLDYKDQKITSETKVWMTFVGDDIYTEIADNRETEAGFRLQVSQETSKGDWMLFAKKSVGTSPARILAIYQVIEKLNVKVGVTPNAYLEPIHVFEKSIEIDIHEIDQGANSDLYKSFGVKPVFELDHAGLEVVFDEIEDQLIFEPNVASDIQKKWSKVS